MQAFFRRAGQTLRRKPSPPTHFPLRSFEPNPSAFIEEDGLEDFAAGRYYPVNVGDIFVSKYQVVGKLGFGISSTVWLARDLDHHQFVTLKVYAREGIDLDEIETYRVLSTVQSDNVGRDHVRTCLESFKIARSGGDHHCLVQKPMWGSFGDFLSLGPFTPELLRAGLKQIFRALDFLHTDCRIVHTDIKADNVLVEITDESVLTSFVKEEMTNPSKRKLIDDMPVYASKAFSIPKTHGKAVLGDFGAAVPGDKVRNHDAQPNIYRSPEVMLNADWSYPIDIWNVGTVIWDLFEGRHLFQGDDPDGEGYSTRAHLAEVVGMLGPPPLDLFQRGKRSDEFFTEQGHWKQNIEIPKHSSLESNEWFLQGDDKRDFLHFVRKMLQWRPEDRQTAKQLLDDEWLNR